MTKLYWQECFWYHVQFALPVTVRNSSNLMNQLLVNSDCVVKQTYHFVWFRKKRGICWKGFSSSLLYFLISPFSFFHSEHIPVLTVHVAENTNRATSQHKKYNNKKKNTHRGETINWAVISWLHRIAIKDPVLWKWNNRKGNTWQIFTWSQVTKLIFFFLLWWSFQSKFSCINSNS